LNDLEKNIKDKKRLAGNIMYKQKAFDAMNQAPERITEEIVTIEKL